MIQIVIRTSTGEVYGTYPLSWFPPGWTFHDLKTWLDMLKEHTQRGELRAYWKVTRDDSKAGRNGSV